MTPKLSIERINMAKLNFTKATLDSIPTPDKGKRVEVWDTKVAGLQIRITDKAVRTFYIRRRVQGGNPERIMLGRYPGMSVDQARKQAAEINMAISSGQNPAQAKRKGRAELTFSDLFTEYYERHALPSKRTAGEDKTKYEMYLRKPLAIKKLSTITRMHVAAIHSNITRAGHPIVANRVKSLVSSIFGWAISVGLTESNPATGIKANREHSRDRFLKADELPRFFSALDKEQNKTLKDYFMISLLTGARQANVMAMCWDDIDFDRSEWYIEKTKNGTSQTVALVPEAIIILQARKKAKDTTIFVFPGNGMTGHIVEPKAGWKRIIDRANLKDVRIHDLRRTLGSWQARTGASLVVIGKSLNHKHISTTAIYSRLDINPVRESVARATSAMLATAKVKNNIKVVGIKNNSPSGNTLFQES